VRRLRADRIRAGLRERRLLLIRARDEQAHARDDASMRSRSRDGVASGLEVGAEHEAQEPTLWVGEDGRPEVGLLQLGEQGVG
jgi:hypothetical protein